MLLENLFALVVRNIPLLFILNLLMAIIYHLLLCKHSPCGLRWLFGFFPHGVLSSLLFVLK